MTDWTQYFNPLLWLGYVTLGFFCAVIAGVGLCILAAFILVIRKLWVVTVDAWHNVDAN